MIVRAILHKEDVKKRMIEIWTEHAKFNCLIVFQQLLEGPMEVLLCERVNDLCHSLFHLLNPLITTASELRE